MSKKHDLPAFPFYFGDWRKAPEVRALDLDVRMIWFEMMGYMWESTERGYLTINGHPPSTDTLARMLGLDITKLEKALKQMQDFDVYSVRDIDGAIFSRKMVHDISISEKRSGAGKNGMKSRYSGVSNNNAITKGISNTEYENENENESTIIPTKEEKGGTGEKTQDTTTPPADPLANYNPAIQSRVAENIFELTRYLNSKTGGALKADHPEYCSIIWQRLQDGYSLDQLRIIIDTMVPIWLGDPKTRMWLTPTTLFRAEKIDEYLNASRPLVTADVPASIPHKIKFDQP